MNFDFYSEISPFSGLYIHTPFCAKKCGYCDFYSRPGATHRALDLYTEEIIEELGKLRHMSNPLTLKTIYMGGGNPGILGTVRLKRIMTAIQGALDDPGPVEWTVEINPENLNKEMLLFLIDSPVSRISTGIQSFNPETHQTLGRNSTIREQRRALELLAGRWMRSFNADLIFAVPGQKPVDAEVDLNELLAYNPDHLSLYSLIPEESTPVGKKIQMGYLRVPEDSVVLEMERIQRHILHEKGYDRYEISNFSRPGKESRHNLCYWNMDSYLGVGEGAVSTLRHGKRGIVRVNWPGNGEADYESLSSSDFMKDWIMMNLRKTEGISLEIFKSIFSAEFMTIFHDTLKELTGREQAVLRNDRFYFTDRGLDLFNPLVSRLFDAVDKVQPVQQIHWPL